MSLTKATHTDDDLWWKTIFSGIRPLVEDGFQWKTTFGGRQPLGEDELRWKQPSVVDDRFE